MSRLLFRLKDHRISALQKDLNVSGNFKRHFPSIEDLNLTQTANEKDYKQNIKDNIVFCRNHHRTTSIIYNL